jgi:hypothetical protein
MKKLYYIKEGRRYVPVSEYDSDLLDSFHKGAHIVMSYPGGSSRRYNIDPAFGPMIAAGRYAEDAISKKIMDTSALRVPQRDQPLTPAQLKAWKALAKAFGKEQYALEWCSYREAAEAGVDAMQKEADKMLTNPAVKKAWDYFMMVWSLTKEKEHVS